jgi:hypothetical protein
LRDQRTLLVEAIFYVLLEIDYMKMLHLPLYLAV